MSTQIVSVFSKPFYDLCKIRVSIKVSGEEEGGLHMVSLETAVKIVKHCAISRIPEPLLQAHKLATKERIRLVSEGKVNIYEK